MLRRSTLSRVSFSAIHTQTQIVMINEILYDEMYIFRSQKLNRFSRVAKKPLCNMKMCYITNYFKDK